jgi:hypothetical protein
MGIHHHGEQLAVPAYPDMPRELVPGNDALFTRAYIDRLHAQIMKALESISQWYIDQSNRVDEYRPQSLSGESLTVELGQPDYECDEIITGVIVTGPPALNGEQDAVIPAGAGTTTITLPAGASLTGFYAETTPGTATSTTVVVAGATTGPMTFEFTQTASGPGSQLNQPFPQPLVPANPAVGITVTFNGSASTNAGNLTAFYQTASSFILQLGQRVWNLVLPVTGILTIGPVQMKLSRSSVRQLTGSIPGDWAFELTGYAETGRRGRI